MSTRAVSSRFFFLASVLMPVSVLAGAKPLVYGNVSGWTVLTDPEHDYRCFAEARYEGGSFIRLGYSSEAALYMTVGNAAWVDAVAGRDYVLELKFDDEVPHRFSGQGIADGGGLRLVVPDGQRESFMQNFMSGYSVSVGRTDDEPVTLSLGGSLNATRLLEDCEDAMTGLRQGGVP